MLLRRSFIFNFFLASVFVLSSGCSSFDFHVSGDRPSVPPSLVIIDTFELRDFSFDPHIAREFSEALRFELFKRGYAAVVSDRRRGGDGASLSERAGVLCRDMGGDIFISGVISRRETGFLSERKVSTGISFLVFTSRGVLIGEGYFSVSDSPDFSVTGRRAAKIFAGELVSRVWGG